MALALRMEIQEVGLKKPRFLVKLLKLRNYTGVSSVEIGGLSALLLQGFGLLEGIGLRIQVCWR